MVIGMMTKCTEYRTYMTEEQVVLKCDVHPAVKYAGVYLKKRKEFVSIIE